MSPRTLKIALPFGSMVGLITVIIGVNVHLSWQPLPLDFAPTSGSVDAQYLPIAWRGSELWLLTSVPGLSPGKTIPKVWRRALYWNRSRVTLLQTAINDEDLVSLSPTQGEFARVDGEYSYGDAPQSSIQIWRDRKLQKQLKERDYHASYGLVKAGPHTLFAFSPDGKHLICDSELSVYAPDEPANDSDPPGFRPYGAALFDVGSGKQIARQSVGQGGLTGFAWSPDSKEVVGITADGWVLVLDGTTGKMRLKFRAHQLFGAQIVWAPDRKTLITASNPRAGFSPTHLGYALSSGVSFAVQGTGTMMSDVAPSHLAVNTAPNGDTTWNGRTERLLKRFDARTGQQVGTSVPLETGAVDLAFSPDGKQLALGEHGFALLLSANTLATERRLNIPATATPSLIPLPVCVAWSPDGATLATSTQQGLTFWRIK